MEEEETAAGSEPIVLSPSKESTTSVETGKVRGIHSGNVASEYDQHLQMSIVDDISKQLEDMKENLVKTSVRCHMLEVDLATQFSPYMADTLRKVKQDCEKCTAKIKTQERSSPQGEPCTSTE